MASSKSSKPPPVYLPFVEEDELMGIMADKAREYDKQKNIETTAKDQKEGLRDWLKDRLELLTITAMKTIGTVDGVYLSKPDEHGKALLWRRVIQNRSNMSKDLAAKLLELGVPAHVIEAATEMTPTESWRLDTVNVGVVIEESDT